MLLIVLIIFIIIIRFNSAQIKGNLGERKVAKRLETLNNSEYKVINNLMLKTERGSTQIDHIVVSVYGIFVIETKNYTGLIFGSEHDDNWKQVIYKRHEKFRNPIKQNYGHIAAVKEKLNLSDSSLIIPVIAFTDRAKLKVNTKTPVIYDNNIIRYIRGFNIMKISTDRVNEIYNVLINSNIDCKEARKEHVNNIRNDIKERENKIRNNICPRCGNMLVVRNGKYGSFVGCSGFPKCRFIKK